MSEFFNIIISLMGVAFAMGLVWFHGYRRLQFTRFDMDRTLQKTEAALHELRSNLLEKEQKLAHFQDLYAEQKSHSAMLDERASRVLVLEKNLESCQQELHSLRSRLSETTAHLDNERTQSKEKIKLLEDLQVKMTQAFRSLSAEALSANNQSFLHLAHSTLEKFQEKAKIDLTHRQQAIGELLNPVQQALAQVDGKIQDLEKQRLGAYEVLKQQVTDLISSQKELRSETANLVKALRAPTVRGQWGEMQLKRVVEMSGMMAHCDFIEQVHVDGEAGRLRPDMVVKLPGGKKIIVDAKAPLAAYLDSLDASDETARQEKLADHARHVRTHIRQLSQRAYWDQFPSTPEFVILFLPGETFFSAALEKDPSLIEVGVKEKVILATPTTLIALLRAVAYGWRQENIAENAKIISDLGRELYKRLGDMGAHFSKLGRSLGHVVDSYNQTLGTLERRVLVTARKFNDLDPGQPVLDDISPLEQVPRSLQSDELSSLLPSSGEFLPQKDVA